MRKKNLKITNTMEHVNAYYDFKTNQLIFDANAFSADVLADMIDNNPTYEHFESLGDTSWTYISELFPTYGNLTALVDSLREDAIYGHDALSRTRAIHFLDTMVNLREEIQKLNQ